MSYLNGNYANNDIPLNGEDGNSTIFNGSNTYTGVNTFTNTIYTNGIVNFNADIFTNTLSTNSDMSVGGDLTSVNGDITLYSGSLTCNNINAININGYTLALTSNNLIQITSPYGGYLFVSLFNPGTTYFTQDVYTQGYFLPLFPLSSTSYRIGLNCMRYLNSSSVNNIAWGTNCMAGCASPSSPYTNTQSRNVCIGDNVLQTPTYGTYGSSDDNVLLGYQVAYGANINFSRNVMIGSYVCSSGDPGGCNDAVVIGYGINKTHGYPSNAVIIGSNNLPSTGFNDGIVVGSGNFANSTFSYANGAVILGLSNLVNSLGFNRQICIGSNSMSNYVNNTRGSIVIGFNSGDGMNLSSSYYNIILGSFADTYNCANSTNIGYNSIADVNDSSTFVIGGNDAGALGLGYTRYQDLLIKKKNRVLCGDVYFYGTTIDLTFESSEYVLINTTSITTINLPAPATTSSILNLTSIGANFKIIRTSPSGFGSNITINAPAGYNIVWNGSTSTTYSFTNQETYVHLVCCFAATSNPAWAVCNSQKVAVGYLTTSLAASTYQTIAGMSSYLTTAAASSTYQTISNTTSILNAFGRTNFATYLSVTSDAINITNINTPEFVVLNSASITSIYLPLLDSTKIGMKVTIVKGTLAYGKQIQVITNNGNIYNTHTTLNSNSTTINATGNYLTFICVAFGSSSPAVDWIAITGQDYYSGTFSLSGRYYIGSSNSLNTNRNTFTISAPYSQYISVGASVPITITFPKITSLNSGLVANNTTAQLTSTSTGQQLVLRRTVNASLTNTHTLTGYTFTNTYYNQSIFDTTNTAITTWTSYLLKLVPLAYIKSDQVCSITLNTTTNIHTVTPQLTFSGTITNTSNVFTPSVITTSTASTSGTTLTLSASNPNVAIGQIVSATGMTTGVTIINGSGLLWGLSSSITLTTRTFSFYPSYMTSPYIYTGTGTGYWMSSPTLNQAGGQILYATAINYATNNIPTYTMNANSSQTLSNVVFSFYPMNIINNISPYDPKYNANENLNPVLVSTSYDNVFINTVTLSTAAVPTITISNAPASTTFTTTTVALQAYGWFQI